MMKKWNFGRLSKDSLPGVFNTNLSYKPFQLVLAQYLNITSHEKKQERILLRKKKGLLKTDLEVRRLSCLNRCGIILLWRRQREPSKSNRFHKNKTLHVRHTFRCIFLPSCTARLRREMPNFT